MGNTQPRPKKQRGTTLIEVLMATVILTLAFLFVSGDMIASTQTEKQATQRGIAISMGNYFLDQMRSDSGFWNLTSPGPGEWDGTNWTGAPAGTDPCGNAWPPYNDSIAAPTWHAVPMCANSPFNNNTNKGTYQYMWLAQEQADPRAANLTVWIQVTPVGGGGTPEIYQLNELNRNDPSLNLVGVFPPSPSPSPTPTPTPSPHSPTPTPSHTATATPSHTPTPSPTPTPSHTPTPSPSPTSVE